MRKQRPKIYWGIVDDGGFVYPFTIRSTKRLCCMDFCCDFRPTISWEEARDKGFKAVKVKVEAL